MREIAAWYDDDERFRSTVVMARHGFGDGEYKYFAYPLPPLIDALRREAYPPLARVANRWAERLGEKPAFPATLDRFTRFCHAAGQKKPTPLVLRYAAGGYNRLHQDLYGAIAFPIQMAILLSRPSADFDGRRIHPGRTKAAHAVARGGRSTTPGRCGAVCRQ